LRRHITKLAVAATPEIASTAIIVTTAPIAAIIAIPWAIVTVARTVVAAIITASAVILHRSRF